MDIRNIFCIGLNYADHAKEQNKTLPSEPLIFTKPTNALAWADGTFLDYSVSEGRIDHDLEVVLYIGEDPGDQPIKVDEIVSHMALGLDLTRKDVHAELKQQGKPWILAKGFKNSAVLTDFWPFPGEAVCREETFALTSGNNTIQAGNIQSMVFSFYEILTYIQMHFGLKKGDIVFTGTPAGVASMSDGKFFELWWGDQLKGRFGVHFT